MGLDDEMYVDRTREEMQAEKVSELLGKALSILITAMGNKIVTIKANEEADGHIAVKTKVYHDQEAYELSRQTEMKCDMIKTYEQDTCPHVHPITIDASKLDVSGITGGTIDLRKLHTLQATALKRDIEIQKEQEYQKWIEIYKSGILSVEDTIRRNHKANMRYLSFDALIDDAPHWKHYFTDAGFKVGVQSYGCNNRVEWRKVTINW